VPKKLVHVQGRVKCFVTWYFLWWGFVSTKPNLEARGPPPVGRPRLLIEYIIRYHPHLEAVCPSATWRRAMPWWQEPTYHNYYLEDLGVDGRIILKLILRKYDGRWAGLIWLRTGGRLLWMR